MAVPVTPGLMHTTAFIRHPLAGQGDVPSCVIIPSNYVARIGSPHFATTVGELMEKAPQLFSYAELKACAEITSAIVDVELF